MRIISISGGIGSGKDYIANNVLLPMLSNEKTIILAFAFHFKVDAIVQEGLDREKVYGRKDEHTRIALQTRGQAARDVNGPNHWTKVMDEWLYIFEQQGFKNAIITDMRYKSELDYIRGKQDAIVVKIEAPERTEAALRKEANYDEEVYQKILAHQSEQDLAGFKGYDYVIHNNPNDNPFVEVRNMIEFEEKIRKQPRVFFVDMDNTICECHEYYLHVHRKVAELLRDTGNAKAQDGLAWVVEFDKIMRNKNGGMDHRRFKREDFPTFLVQAFTDVYLAHAGPQVHERDVELFDLTQRVDQIGNSVYDFPYAPLPGALEALERLKEFGQVVITTHGNRLEQLKKVAQLGVTGVDVEIGANKNKQFYQDLMDKYPARRHMVFGDSLTRDIVYAAQAGVQSSYWICGENDSFKTMVRKNKLLQETVKAKSGRKHTSIPCHNFSQAVEDMIHNRVAADITQKFKI